LGWTVICRPSGEAVGALAAPGGIEAPADGAPATWLTGLGGDG
jgi:hypothetical protein